MIVISDTSPINYLVLIDAVHILPALYGKVFIPEAVYEQLTRFKTPQPVKEWIHQKPDWLEVILWKQTPEIPWDRLLHPGEREVIGLALHLGADLVLLDDGMARQIASSNGLKVTGVAGILEQAAIKGFIDLRYAIEKLTATNYRISDRVLNKLLKSYK